MTKIDDILKKYGSIVANHPLAIIVVVVLITAVALIGVSSLKMESMDMKDMLPEDIPAINAINFVEDEFGGTDSGIIVIEIDPKQNNSDEIRDVRDYRVMNYLDILAQKIKKLDGVSIVGSSADILRKSNNGRLPKSEKSIESLLEKSSQSSRYISEDYSMTLVRISLTDDANKEKLIYELKEIIDETPQPPGVKTQITGEFVVMTAIMEQIGPDMSKTSMYSLMGIMFIIFVLFRSIKHGLSSLMAILFGNVWAFGLMGLLGMTISSATAGASSMIMGIGIDFGIQVVSRFRQELKRAIYTDAMIKTISEVTIPMSTTTLAALIGFRAMAMGELTLMADLGTMMSLGVLCCMIAAITIVPSLLVIWGRYLRKR